MEFANNARFFLIISLTIFILPVFSLHSKYSASMDISKLKTLGQHRMARHVDMTGRDTKNCIINLFEKMQSCCPVPLLIPQESQQKCLNEAGIAMAQSRKGLFQTIREAVISPFARSRSGKMDSETLEKLYVGGPKCFIECSFKEMKLLSEEGRVDSNRTEEIFMSHIKTKKLFAPWVPIVQKVLNECSTDMESIQVSSITAPQGKTCSTHPGVYMECLRRGLILGCPEDQFSLSPGCISARTELVKCNPVEMSKAMARTAK